MTVLRLLAAGHRSASMAYLTVGALLVGLAGGIIGTAVRATGVADELRGADVVTTDTAAEWGNYQGVADYTFMVAAIACIVGMILVASAAQFLVASFGTTSRRLRMLGASRRAVRWRLTAAVTVVSALTVPLGVVLSPVAARGFRLLLERIGLSTTGPGTAWTPQPALIAGICLMGWGVLAVWWQARHLAGLAEDAQVPTRRRHRHRILAVPVLRGLGWMLPVTRDSWSHRCTPMPGGWRDTTRWTWFRFIELIRSESGGGGAPRPRRRHLRITGGPRR